MPERYPLVERKTDLARQAREAAKIAALAPIAARMVQAAGRAELHVELPDLVIHAYPDRGTIEEL